MTNASSRARLVSAAVATLLAAILPLRVASADDDGWGDEQWQGEDSQGDMAGYGYNAPGNYPPPPMQYYYGPPEGYYVPTPPQVYYGPPSAGFQLVLPLDRGD